MKKGVNPRKVVEISISSSIANKLDKASVETVDDLVALCEREILSIKGIGTKSLKEILEALDSLKLKLADDPFGKLVCSRHNKKRSDTRIRSYFLCKQCSVQFQTQALNQASPIFVLKVVDDHFHCSHCNEIKQLGLYQWYVCDVCDRVLRSIGRGIASNKGVAEWWKSRRKNETFLPKLIETDPPMLRTITNARPKANLDFTAITEDNIPLFGAELKTGRNHLQGGNIGAGMTRFQLDVSDIESVLNDMEQNNHYIPAYLFHCQVVDIPKPPTVKFECVGIWWVSITNLIDNIEEIKQRPRENRPAAYIKTRAFERISSFIDEVKSKGYLDCPPPSDLRKELNSKKENMG